jgi:hypothetical protein
MRSGPDELRALANVGAATQADFAVLGIDTVAQLAKQEADELYGRLNEITGRRHDPCVWDTFAATIHQARTGEAKPWWHWTAERKRRRALGDFDI